MGECNVKIEKLAAAEGMPGYFPPGAVKTEGGFHICTMAEEENVSLAVFEMSGGKEKRRIFSFPSSSRLGNMCTIKLLGEDFSGLSYSLICDGTERPDPFGRVFTGRETWGELSHVKNPLRTLFELPCFDWEDDRPLQIPYEDMILYRIHTRGFTMGKGGTDRKDKKAGQPGTFRAIRDKIPYFKELGVTSLELMPPNEFEEVMMPDSSDGNPYGPEEPTGKLNYWGYGPGLLFAPKASYSEGEAGKKNPSAEFKSLVKELHKNGLELIIELYFTGKESASFISEAVRFWVREYHVDGVHLVGISACPSLADDPWLSRTKLFAAFWEDSGSEKGKQEKGRHLAEYNDGFLVDMRRLLKGDEDQMNSLIFRSRRNPGNMGVINYMAHSNGFTLTDSVSYEMKHNEANGENNQDGSAWNYTWNCGAEGPSRKKKIVNMRQKQLRNALLILFLSQGTPLLLAGDEFGFSKGGNNNAYCQDNAVSWLDWRLLEANRELFEFTKQVIAFRKRHPVFHMPKEPAGIDYLVCGHPDVSYHGVKAWCPEFENFRRQLGIMYCGDYAKKPDGSSDDFFFTAYNMHWEPHEFALPKLPRGMKWHLAFNTDDREKNGIYTEGEEPCLEEQKQFLVPSRSIVVFIGLKDPDLEKNGKKSGKRTDKKAEQKVKEKTGQTAEKKKEKTVQKKKTGKVSPKNAAKGAAAVLTAAVLALACGNPFDGSFTALAAGPGTPAYTQGDPYNSYQWAFLNNGQFRLVTGTQNMNSSIPGHLSGSQDSSNYGPETEGKATAFAKAGMDISLTSARKFYDALENKGQVVVAVIDTGVQTDHEDLRNSIWTNRGEIAGDGVDNDKNGFVDDIHGWNFYSGNGNLYQGSEDNHGTHSAGTIAAEKNGVGITGICDPDYVKVMPLKVLGTKDGIGTPENVAKAIRYAEAQGASICNLSFGTGKFNQELYDTMKNSEMLFVVAAGNGDKEGKGINLDERPVYPAAFDLDNIISVASMRLDGTLEPSSNYGSGTVDLAAPGKYILSTISDGQYAYMSGTSMAAPMVSGAAALIKSARPNLSTGKIREILLDSSKKNSSMEGRTATGGVLDAGKAMELAEKA